jgi:hypothetical protein
VPARELCCGYRPRRHRVVFFAARQSPYWIWAFMTITRRRYIYLNAGLVAVPNQYEPRSEQPGQRFVNHIGAFNEIIRDD